MTTADLAELRRRQRATKTAIALFESGLERMDRDQTTDEIAEWAVEAERDGMQEQLKDLRAELAEIEEAIGEEAS